MYLQENTKNIAMLEIYTHESSSLLSRANSVSRTTSESKFANSG